MLDHLTAWLLVGLLAASPWLLVILPAVAAGAVAAALVQYYRRGGVRAARRDAADQRTAVGALARRVADAHAGRRRAEEHAAAYQHRVERERTRAGALAADVHELSLALQRETARRPGPRLVSDPVGDGELLAVAAAAGVLTSADRAT